MNKKENVIKQITESGLLPLYYHEDKEVSIAILRSLYSAGVRILEYTNRGENALINFQALKTVTQQEMPDLLLGIGTIKTAETAKRFLDAGADFIVSPIVSAEVAAIVREQNLAWIPGCLTPTEIHEAELLGASLVKIFPGNLVGPSYIQTIKDIFPDLLFMPTGGVEPEEKNLKSWFGAGVVAVGMGSKLLQTNLINEGNFEALTDYIKKANLLIQSCR
ncbi:bifunctional 4-hydroxy-2-oxoglutarate aldolase/2-dehydro-3-deoxy-phosphogluconate aldolase [Flavobacterium sp. JAS]|uniref:bifunctional 4-hydroxy-2-oxoglutarate aldolase/2-dehydro-3-deoxy-phosphogluconate aldolase n=1 Tax=Flavobacterium sp. JAS TaxID=2897329 RepID=UPI001E33CB50|nr:bifunctional 4-hydroxy-2-oxoglutarate aldolase/2-dehydro-3-deoxy-phosphogluconate aldolase [Flavobacterium sp. JAS]MCD0468797.1 bifunctional 4-hydroxy-2-oxoglutarate aldolase/2-dehydro-3-deoxy-phosphogluconate aldolase [Flavobacterium sp. JAS]